MASSSTLSKVVIGVHLGQGDAGPAVAMVEERRSSSPRFTLRHLVRLPSRLSDGAFASGLAETLRKQEHEDLDWRLVVGSTDVRRAAPEAVQEDLWPLVRAVEAGRTPLAPAAGDRTVSEWTLAGALRSHFESGELQLAASLLRVRQEVDGLLESVLGPQLVLTTGVRRSRSTHLDDLVIAAGLAVWWAKQGVGAGPVLRSPAPVPRVLSSGDLL